MGINHDFLVQFIRVQSLFPIFNNKKNTQLYFAINFLLQNFYLKFLIGICVS